MKPLFFVHIPKTGGTSLMVQAKEQGLKWGENNPHYANQPLKHHQPLQWFVSDRKSRARDIIDTHELFAILRDPLDRFVSDIKWHIEKRPETLQAFGYTRQELERDIRPFVHDVLDLIESLAIDEIEPIPNDLIPFRVRRRFQKRAIQKAGLRNFGYAHFLPQKLFCEYHGKEIISEYFNLTNIKVLEGYLGNRGVHFSSRQRANQSQLALELRTDEIQRIQHVYADDIRFCQSKRAVGKAVTA